MSRYHMPGYPPHPEKVDIKSCVFVILYLKAVNFALDLFKTCLVLGCSSCRHFAKFSWAGLGQVRQLRAQQTRVGS